MDDLAERLRQIEDNPSPDLWHEITRRPAHGLEPRGPRHRLAAGLVAAVVSIAALAFLISVFRSEPAPQPATPRPVSVGNGDIWVQVGGGDGGTAIYRVDPQLAEGPQAMWSDGRDVFSGATVAPRLISDDYAFSPDGNRVVFSSEVGHSSGELPLELFVMNADGTRLRQLTHDDAYAGFPAWSPDGRTIVYASYRGRNYIPGCLASSICPTDLYVIDADGGTSTRLLGGPESETTPSWSPDGARIAFSEIGNDGDGVIVTVRADGSDRVELSPPGSVSFPAWSPDGRLILFLLMQEGTNHLWTVTADNTGHHDLTDTHTDTNFGRPVWSPDGNFIAFARPYAGTTSLWTIDRDGARSPERIAGWPGFDGSPIAWQPVLAEPAPTESPPTEPSAASSPSSSGGPGTTSLQGVPFPVCRPTSIAGTFGGGDDVAWTFAMERSPGSGCEGRPGVQFVATGSTDRVDQMSEGTTEVMGVEDRWAPYASPDIDGDGIDEIAVATGYRGSSWAIQLWLYQQRHGTVEPVWESSGERSRYGWNIALGRGSRSQVRPR